MQAKPEFSGERSNSEFREKKNKQLSSYHQFSPESSKVSIKCFFQNHTFYSDMASPFSSDPLFFHEKKFKNKNWNGKRIHAYTKVKIVINLYFSKKGRTQEIKIWRKKSSLYRMKERMCTHIHFLDNFFWNFLKSVSKLNRQC